jgi:hypothetical protein
MSLREQQVAQSLTRLDSLNFPFNKQPWFIVLLVDRSISTHLRLRESDPQLIVAQYSHKIPFPEYISFTGTA